MHCPACQAEVEEGADLCLECGEPMGDSPAARVARAEKKAAPPAAPSIRVEEVPSSLKSTMRGKRSAKQILADAEEKDPVRCPGCGTPSRAARCPGCGIPLRPSED